MNTIKKIICYIILGILKTFQIISFVKLSQYLLSALWIFLMAISWSHLHSNKRTPEMQREIDEMKRWMDSTRTARALERQELDSINQLKINIDTNTIDTLRKLDTVKTIKIEEMNDCIDTKSMIIDSMILKNNQDLYFETGAVEKKE